MCGRYTLTALLEDILSEFDCTTSIECLLPRYNIAPSQNLPVIIQNRDTKKRELALMQWGLIPSWAKTFESSYNTINAKAETLIEKPLYRSLIKRKRCLIPADSFYEWQEGPSPKQPWRFMLKDEKVFGFAGLFDEWHSKEDVGISIKTFTIITTQPNELVSPIHNRMPVIIKPEHYEAWLDTTSENPLPLLSFLEPYPANEMKSYKVSTRVNNTRVDDKDCIAHID
jgi:putative SOS response-associated peptidase YedK